MKLTLAEHTPQNIKRVRHKLRRNSNRMNITIRNGNLYTMRYNPGIQPRTESQEMSWSLFKEANRLATSDFHNPSRKTYWQQKLKEQTRYKTARGLAKAYYIKVLKQKMSTHKVDIPAATRLATATIRPILNNTYNMPACLPILWRQSNTTWLSYRNIHYYRHQLKTPNPKT